jgi:uncharacterized protein (UPF0261 family)
MATILIIGTFDTKEVEFLYLRDRILDCNHDVFMVNVGVMSTPAILKVDVDAEIIAQAGNSNLHLLRKLKSREIAMNVMCNGAASVIRALFDEGRFQGIIGMGGGCGTSIITAAMRALPLGVPKVCVSTLASGDVSGYVGTKDIIMFPSLVDLAGLNRISRLMITQAAGAICGMVNVKIPTMVDQELPVIAATMFGNTTECVQACMKRLKDHGYEVLVFHATGTGGKMMEMLIEEGYVSAVLDITTTEIADEVCGGIMSAGETRLTAAGRMGIPQVIAPGCVDMVNFGPRASVPSHYEQAGRTFYSWNPSNTLMRTNITENQMIGAQIAQRLNDGKGSTTVILPLRGLSQLSECNQPFYDRNPDIALFDTLKDTLRPDIKIVEIDTVINDPIFSENAVNILLDLINQHRTTQEKERS